MPISSLYILAKKNAVWLKIAVLIGFILVVLINFKGLSKPSIALFYFSRLVKVNGLWWKILLLFTLVILNYCIEAIKWQKLARGIEYVSFTKSFQSVCIGLLFALFTPARLGELGGRVVLFQRENRLSGVAAVLAGSVSQNLAIFITGSISIVYLLSNGHLLEGLILPGLWILIIVCLIGCIYLYYNLDIFYSRIYNWIKKPKIKHFLAHFQVISKYSRMELSVILLLSFCRVITWTLLYIGIFGLLFQVQVTFDFNAAILFIFLIQTGIPLPIITGFVARGGLAIIVWNQFGVNEWISLLTSFSLYFINLLLPALFGLIVILNKKVKTK